MPKYRVYGAITASKYLGEFEAENEEAAIDLALKENGGVHLCHQCTDECEDPEIYEAEAELVVETDVKAKKNKKRSR